MKIHMINEAPNAIGPYCHAMQTGNLVFCSGQTPLDPETNKLTGNDIKEQTARVLQNLSIVLAGLGLTLQDIVKTNVFLKDMSDFQGMNGIYENMFDGHRPARSTIAIRQNPLDALVEIECIAEIKD